MSNTEQRHSKTFLHDGVVDGLVLDRGEGVTTRGEGVTAGAGEAPGVVAEGQTSV